MLLKLSNTARYLAKGLAVALGYGGFKKKPKAVGLKGRSDL